MLKLFCLFRASQKYTVMSLIHYFLYPHLCIALLYLTLFLCRGASLVLSLAEVSSMLNHTNSAFPNFFQIDIIHFLNHLNSLTQFPTISYFSVYFLFSKDSKICQVNVQIRISQNLNPLY